MCYNVYLNSHADVDGDVYLYSHADVDGDVYVYSHADVGGDVYVYSHADVGGDVYVYSHADASSPTTCSHQIVSTTKKFNSSSGTTASPRLLASGVCGSRFGSRTHIS